MSNDDDRGGQMMFELMDSYSQNAVIKVIGVGGGRRQRRPAYGSG
jgi:cell division GTPase FtsZ